MEEKENEVFDYYIFDLDGVLVDVSDDYKRQVFDEVGDYFGRDFTDEQIRNLWHGIGADSREELLRSWGYENPKDFWEVFDSIDTPERRLEYTFAYDDTSILESIDAPMGVVTHSPPDLAIPVLRRSDLYTHFDSVVSCSYEIGYKPNPAPIRKCIEEIGAEGNEDSTVMVGDSVSDVRGAWNANIHAGHIKRFDHTVEADFNIESLHELDSIVYTDGGYEVLND